MGELLPAWDGSSGESVWAAVVGLGLAEPIGDAVGGETDLQGSLLAGVRVHKCAKIDLSQGFEPFGFREGGWAVVYGEMSGSTLKLVVPVSLSSMGQFVQPKWSLGETDVLSSPEFSKSVQPGGGVISSLRREPRKVLISMMGGSALGEMRRNIKLQGSRLEISDQYQGSGDIISVWNVGLEWTGWEETSKGWVASCGSRTLVAKLHAGLEWSRELRSGSAGSFNVFVGRGLVADGEKVISRFELR
jgi:hypothetical protein